MLGGVMTAAATWHLSTDASIGSTLAVAKPAIAIGIEIYTRQINDLNLGISLA